MKTITAILLFTLCAGSIFGQRKIDFTIRVLEPKAYDTLVSPRDYSGKYAVINLGPDTIRYNDGYTLKIAFGNMVFPPLTGNFGRAVPPGDSIIAKNNLPCRFDATNYRTEICAEIYRIFWVNKKDSIIKETSEMKKNNETCIPMVHISYLSTSQMATVGSVYPNPATDIIRGKLIQPGNITTIYNLQGKMIKNGLLETQELSLKELPPATYLLHISTKEGSSSTILISKH
jgi:hypothetical protein